MLFSRTRPCETSRRPFAAKRPLSAWAGFGGGKSSLITAVIPAWTPQWRHFYWNTHSLYSFKSSNRKNIAEGSPGCRRLLAGVQWKTAVCHSLPRGSDARRVITNWKFVQSTSMSSPRKSLLSSFVRALPLLDDGQKKEINRFWKRSIWWGRINKRDPFNRNYQKQSEKSCCVYKREAGRVGD